MDFDLLVGFIIGLAAGVWTGWSACQRLMISELTNMVMENIVDLTHEVVDDQHYIYYTESGEFGAQGTTLDEAARNFSLRDKSVGRLITSVGKTVFIVDGKIETE